MKRIYMGMEYKSIDEETNKLFLWLANMQSKMKEELEETEFNSWVYEFHNTVREKLGLPNEVITFCTYRDETEAWIVSFPKEPNGNVYKVYLDEELDSLYIVE